MAPVSTTLAVCKGNEAIQTPEVFIPMNSVSEKEQTEHVLCIWLISNE